MLSVTSCEPPAGKGGQGRWAELVAMPQRGDEALVLLWTRSLRWLSPPRVFGLRGWEELGEDWVLLSS